MYLEAHGSTFSWGGKPIRLRGVGLGGWLNLEHFMLGIPGTETEIRSAFAATYGQEAAVRFWDAYFAAYTAEADLHFVQTLGLNSVRVPLNFKLFGQTDGDFATSTAVRELDRIIAIAERLRLLVVLDLHSAPGGQNPDWHCDNATGNPSFWNDPSHRESTIRLWEQLADRYRDNTTVAGYDLINEPCYFDDALNSVLVDFHATCIAAIRKLDRHHIVFVEGNAYARDFTMFERNLDDQVAYCFHYYPFLQLPRNLAGPTTADQLRENLLACVSLHHLQEHLKRPIWCGETGHPWHLPQSVATLRTFLRLLEDLGISWATWPLKDARAMGLLSPKEHSPWMQFISRVAGDFQFWELFTQDSLLAAKAESRRELYYERLASITSDANTRFRERLAGIPFRVPFEALSSFDFGECDQHLELAAQLKDIR